MNPPAHFIPAFYDQASTCELGENACYRVFLARQPEEGSARLSFGLTHREFADTLRLYFNEDVFNHLESLFLVRGEALPRRRSAGPTSSPRGFSPP